MNLHGEYPFAYMQAKQKHMCAAFFASANSDEGQGNDVKNRSFVSGK